MIIDWSLAARIAGPICGAVVGVVLARVIERKPKLITYVGHASAFQLKNPGQPQVQVHTHSIVIRNAGKKPASNVRVSHFSLPNYQVFPDIVCHVEQLPNGNQDIVFPILVPGEQVSISYLYFPPLIWNQVHDRIKFDEGFARVLDVLPTPQLPRWLRGVLWALICIGAFAIVYAAVDVSRLIWGG